ncbi:nicotinate-nucleotide diphosphorylase (carboxylating), partial [Escherichia coli]|nr:nicotinate-nucleotide diphosphorylase (carboxylating) [Escherichia coli]
MPAASQTISDTSTTAPHISSLLRIEIAKQVALALQEDIATGDINAQLIPDTQRDTATIICREPMVVAGK